MKMKILIILILMMLSVGFYTFLERKILGYMNFRKGPNKVVFMGLLQFLMDLLKLIFKENLMLFCSMNFFLKLFILILFLISVMLWVLLPLNLNLINLKMLVLLLIVFMVNKVFLFLNLMWSLNSIYSILSLIRLFIQNFSYEILFMLILFMMIFMFKSFNVMKIFSLFNYSKIIFLSVFILLFWFISILVELNRLPFDFFEGESELVSGFVIEFSSFSFMILFLIEYLDMIFFSFLTLVLFLNFSLNKFYFYLILIFFLLNFLFFRGFLIRYRIDKVYLIFWKIIFPLMMNIFIFSFFLLFFY